MILSITDLKSKKTERIDLKVEPLKFYQRVRRLAEHIDRPLSEVQELLVCGNSFKAAGFSYCLVG